MKILLNILACIFAVLTFYFLYEWRLSDPNNKEITPAFFSLFFSIVTTIIGFLPSSNNAPTTTSRLNIVVIVISTLVLIYVIYQILDPRYINVTVFIEDKNKEIPIKQQGHIIMAVEGGEAKHEFIDDKGTASFKNVKIGDKVRLKVDFSEPYRPINPDSVYTITKDGRVHLSVTLKNLGKIFGIVTYNNGSKVEPLGGVLVDVNGIRDTSKILTGRYEISIPEDRQRQEQDVIFIKKGYITQIKKALPQTNQPLNIIMEKQ